MNTGIKKSEIVEIGRVLLSQNLILTAVNALSAVDRDYTYTAKPDGKFHRIIKRKK